MTQACQGTLQSYKIEGQAVHCSPFARSKSSIYFSIPTDYHCFSHVNGDFLGITASPMIWTTPILLSYLPPSKMRTYQMLQCGAIPVVSLFITFYNILYPHKLYFRISQKPEKYQLQHDKPIHKPPDVDGYGGYDTFRIPY